MGAQTWQQQLGCTAFKPPHSCYYLRHRLAAPALSCLYGASARVWHSVEMLCQGIKYTPCTAAVCVLSWLCLCRAATTGLLDPVTAEKQISLLSRGLTHHPSSAQLLLALLRCYAAVAPDAEALEAKWAAVLSRQGGSWELWREYITLRWVDGVGGGGMLAGWPPQKLPPPTLGSTGCG